MAAHLLGEDGRGYELARRLEACGSWRAWLGDGAHAVITQHLASPATWDAFLSPSSSPSPPRQLVFLQLRVRALLFDKASAVLIPRGGASPAGPHSLNASYLQLHGDDIYYSLEDDQEENTQHQMQSRSAFSPSRESSMLSQRHNRYDELPDTWYKQYAEKFRTLHRKFRLGDKEIPKRTPEGMSDYLKDCIVHKRRRTLFMNDQVPNMMLENGPSLQSKNAVEFSNLTDDVFIPEIRFPSDCVPESAIPRASGISRTNKIEVHGVLDNLPASVSRNTAMLERFGMMPEYYKTGNKYRGKDGSKVEGKSLSQQQALVITRKLVARNLANAGFDSGTAVSVDILSEIIIKHFSKLGRRLKLLTDSYRKQFSSIELLKMFLQTIGYSNIGPLMEITKMGNRVVNHPIQQDAQLQNQNKLLLAQQLSRQFPPQMSIHTQNLTPQQHQLLQQQQWLRRNQMTSPRGPLTMAEKNQAMVNVKLENSMDSQIESPYGSLARQQQMLQLRQQQMLQQQQQQQLQQQQQHQLQQHYQQKQQQLQPPQQQQLQQQQLQLQHHHQLQQQQLQQQHQQQQLAMSGSQNAQLAQQMPGSQNTQLGQQISGSQNTQLAQQMSGNQNAQLLQHQSSGNQNSQLAQHQMSANQNAQLAQHQMSANQNAQLAQHQMSANQNAQLGNQMFGSQNVQLAQQMSGNQNTQLAQQMSGNQNAQLAQQMSGNQNAQLAHQMYGNQNTHHQMSGNQNVQLAQQMSGNQNAQLAQQMSGNQNAQLAQQMSGNQNAQLAQQMSGNQNAELAQQFKQASSMSAYGMRMPPVKVEAFHELVSGNSSNDTSKLTSPK